jgi:ubiquinone/menaquinone biosynthesis C-methylase UbiE
MNTHSPPSLPNQPDPTAIRYRTERAAHWDAIARRLDTWRGWGGAYHQRLTQIYQFLVPPGQSVLEVGCGKGDLLAALQPSRGVGVDFSAEMIQRAAVSHPELRFVHADAHDLTCVEGTFDMIILSDTVNDLWDVQAVFEQLVRLSTPRTRIILNFYSHLWELPLKLAQKLGLATQNLEQNWLTVEDIHGLLNLAGFETIRQWTEILWPLPFPVLGGFINRFLIRFWPFKSWAWTNFMVARPQPQNCQAGSEPSVSVIIPARNEAGNIAAIFERIPRMGREMELIFVEGHSRDDSYAVIEKALREHPAQSDKLLMQTGVGKADAVRLGFEHANGDILIILDADLTVSLEDLPRFYEALFTGKGELINGVRLVYPMEHQAMRWLNFLGNKMFSLAFSWLLGQPIKDTLCGTKALWMSDYKRIAAGRSYFGDFDPFGDFDLLFGAAKSNRKILDLPIRYRERTYGTTNIQRWKHGWLLLKMVWFAAIRLKFV